jgi:glutathione-regulated potassium-efflux system ancillary protein KefG
MKVLILFAHPAIAASRVQRHLYKAAQQVKDVTLHNLYQLYPDFDIDIKAEQALLAAHDVIIWQHPWYWYSAPPIVKQWQDLVLEHGWAYGSMGKQLLGKWAMNVITTGGPQTAYTVGGHNRYTIQQFLVPFEQTTRLCNMQYLPPFVIHGTHKMSEADISICALQYQEFLLGLSAGRFTLDELQACSYSNDLVPIPNSIQNT